MKSEKMIRSKDGLRQNCVGSSGRPLNEIASYLAEGRRLQAECLADLLIAAGCNLKTVYGRSAMPLARAGTRILGAGKMLYYYFTSPGKIGVVCKCGHDD